MNSEAIDRAIIAIGGNEPSRFILPHDMACYVIPPPNGKTAIIFIAKYFVTSDIFIRMNNFNSNFSEVIRIRADDIEGEISAIENYQESIITVEDLSFISYLEYWEDLAVIFVRYPINDLMNAKLKELSKGWKNYLENLGKLSNANTVLIDKLLMLPSY